MKAALHSAEEQRLAALRHYQILDTPREKEFDDIVRVVSAICEAPVSVINLIDEGRQWFKAEVGLGVRETPLPASICAHAILQHGLFVVPDTLEDRRFSDNPLVTGAPGFRFYAGALLETSQGFPLGTLCVLDYKPRTLNENQTDLLRVMAGQIMKLLEVRQLMAAERGARARAEALLKENEILVRESDHRVMNSLQLVSSVLGMQARGASAKARAELEEARRRVLAIATVHRELHQSGSLAEIEIAPFLKRLCDNLSANGPAQVALVAVADEARVASGTASTLGLIVAELVANSFKHAFANGRAGTVTVTFSTQADAWSLGVADDGAGLAAGFDPTQSKGVGMRVVIALARRLDAGLEVSSKPAKTAFVVARAGG